MSKNLNKPTKNNEESSTIEKKDQLIVKNDLKAMYQSISGGQTKKVVIDNSNISKDASTNVYLDKITSNDELLKLKSLIFNNVKILEATISPYKPIISMFTRISSEYSNKLVNLTKLILENCEITSTDYYGLIKMTGFDNLKEFTSKNVNISNVDKNCHIIKTLQKRSLDERSTKLTYNVTESDFPINFAEEKNYKLIESIKSHKNVEYHNLDEANVSGELNQFSD